MMTGVEGAQLGHPFTVAKAPQIYGLLSKVMAEVGVVGKSRRNTQGAGYAFRGIDDVVAAVQDIMAKHGVVCVPRVVERERESITTKSGGGMISVRLLVEHHFYAPDGSSVVCTTLGEAFDAGDKSSNKAMSAALKYALTQTLLIPTYEVERDTEEQTHEVAPPKPPGGISDEDLDAFDLVRLDLLQVWPGDGGEDREQRLGWYWSQFRPTKTAKMPADWNPAKAFAQADSKRRAAIKQAAYDLASKSHPDREAEQEG